jgi:NADPH-dependent 2,4-dienoyl-CoA reductase/sulfur reductase-like enzyme
MTTSALPSPTEGGMRIVIVGGVAGGMSAAARARRLDEHAEIVVLEQGAYVSFANCGLPYHLSGEIAGRDALLLHTPASLAASLNLDVRTGHRVTAIDRHARKVTIAAEDAIYLLPYDALILAPGAVAVRPPIAGLDHPAVHSLRTVPDVDALRERIDDLLAAREQRGQAPRAVVIGAGFIGLEAVEALTARGLRVHLLELADHVLPPLDAELAPLLADELAAHGVDLRLGVSAQAVTAVVTAVGAVDQSGEDSSTGAVTVTLSGGATLAADLVIVNVGVRPASMLAREAGLELGPTGAIRVDADQHTCDPHIWAVGDAVEVTQAITGARIQVPRPRGRTRPPWPGTASPTRWCTFTRATTRATTPGPNLSTSSRASPPMAGCWEPRGSAVRVGTSASTSSPRPSGPACAPTTSPSWSSPMPRRTAPPRTR